LFEALAQRQGIEDVSSFHLKSATDQLLKHGWPAFQPMNLMSRLTFTPRTL